MLSLDLPRASDAAEPQRTWRARRLTGLARQLAWFWTVSVIASLLLAGCGRESPAAGPATPPLPAHPRVLVFGDSYTQGGGADPSTRGYAHQLGDQLGWEVTVDGVGGTGYVAPGSHQKGPFLKRIGTAATGPFDLIVVQGSSNDERQPLDQLSPAVDSTVSALRAKYPGARVVMMGPIALYGSVPPSKEAVNNTLKSYAASHNVSFIDPIAEAWFAHGESTTMANPANGHPSNAGHIRIRDRLIIDLSRITAAPGPG